MENALQNFKNNETEGEKSKMDFDMLELTFSHIWVGGGIFILSAMSTVKSID